LQQGFGKDSSLSKTLRLLRQELIVEKMFNEDVDSKIIISDEQLDRNEQIATHRNTIVVRFFLIIKHNIYELILLVSFYVNIYCHSKLVVKNIPQMLLSNYSK